MLASHRPLLSTSKMHQEHLGLLQSCLFFGAKCTFWPRANNVTLCYVIGSSANAAFFGVRHAKRAALEAESLTHFGGLFLIQRFCNRLCLRRRLERILKDA